MSLVLRDLTDLTACREVVSLQAEVWGRDAEIVPASVLFVSAKRGGILIGAYDDQGLAGFVWSMPGWKDRQPSHWSHMLAVRPRARRHGLGEELKRAQRDRALAQGVGVIEWTFDPLQSANAHLNFAKLGAIATTYLVNAYGEMPGPLHRGTPTDRLIVEWRIDSGRTANVPARAAGRPLAIATHESGRWVASGDVREDLKAETILIPIPQDFTEMQRAAQDIALAWRAATRQAFEHYLQQGYVVVGFADLKYTISKSSTSSRSTT
jgi:predicted GNAT superfamily acetyltransferase